jgi:hypothetical protein
MNTEEAKIKFRAKNARRKQARDASRDSTLGQVRYAKLLRCNGITKKIKESFVALDGEIFEEDVEITGVPGAFGWGHSSEWNARLLGTVGEER